MNDQNSTTRNHSGLPENIASALAYITMVPAVLLLILPPYSRRENVRFHAYQSVFLNATLIAVVFFTGLVSAFAQLLDPNSAMSPSFALIWTVRIATVAVWAAVAITVARGNRFRLPLFGALAERQVENTSHAQIKPVPSQHRGAVTA